MGPALSSGWGPGGGGSCLWWGHWSRSLCRSAHQAQPSPWPERQSGQPHSPHHKQGPKPALCICPEPTGPQSEPSWGSSKTLRGLSCWVIRGPSMLSPAMKSPGWQAGLRNRGQPPGGEWEGAERESAAHSPSLGFSLWQQEEGEPQGEGQDSRPCSPWARWPR